MVLQTNIPWQIRERHAVQTRLLMKELGFTDDNNRILRFAGLVWWPKYAELGHDHMEVQNCKCRKEPFDALRP